MLTTKMQATVYSVQKAFGPNGEQYVKTFIGLNSSSDDEFTKGLSLMSFSTEPRVFDQLPKTDQPFLAEIEMTVIRGGQNKAKQHVINLMPVRVTASAKN